MPTRIQIEGSRRPGCRILPADDSVVKEMAVELLEGAKRTVLFNNEAFCSSVTVHAHCPLRLTSAMPSIR